MFWSSKSKERIYYRTPTWNKIKAGKDVGCGRDHTLYALKDGILEFTRTGYINVIEESIK